MALNGHRLLQMRQPEHFSSSIEARIGSRVNVPAGSWQITRAAAAAPWATLAGISLGPWAQPAMINTFGHGGNRIQLGVAFDHPAIRTAGDAK